MTGQLRPRLRLGGGAGGLAGGGEAGGGRGRVVVVVVVVGRGRGGGNGRGVGREVLVEAVVRHGSCRAVGQRQAGAGTRALLHRVAGVQVARQRSYLVPQDSKQQK